MINKNTIIKILIMIAIAIIIYVSINVNSWIANSSANSANKYITNPSTTYPPTTMEPTTMETTTYPPTTMAPTTMAPTTMAPTTMAPTNPSSRYLVYPSIYTQSGARYDETIKFIGNRDSVQNQCADACDKRLGCNYFQYKNPELINGNLQSTCMIGAVDGSAWNTWVDSQWNSANLPRPTTTIAPTTMAPTTTIAPTTTAPKYTWAEFYYPTNTTELARKTRTIPQANEITFLEGKKWCSDLCNANLSCNTAVLHVAPSGTEQWCTSNNSSTKNLARDSNWHTAFK